jgi:hypothetical protein
VEVKLRNQKGPDGVALGDKAIQILMDESIARYILKQRPAITKPPPTIMPKSIYPKPSKTTKTRVASPCGPQAELKGLETPSNCGWVQGLLQKFVPTCKKPYLVRWATKPAVQMQVSQRRMRQLVNNYKYCEEHEVFLGFVGRELLWVTKKSGCKEYLRYVKVMAFPKITTRLYLLAYRDGSTFEITPEQLDRAVVRHGNIAKGVGVPIDFDTLGVNLVTFQPFHINAAEREKIVYPVAKSPFIGSATTGNDFETSYSEDEEPVVKKVTQRKNFRTVPGTAPDETEEKAHDDVVEASKNVDDTDQDSKRAKTDSTNDSDANHVGLQGIGVGEHDDCLTSRKGPDQDIKPAETQGTNVSDKTINDKTLGDASLVADDVGSKSLKVPEQDTKPAERQGTNDSGQNIDGLQDDTVWKDDDSVPSNKDTAKDTEHAETKDTTINDKTLADESLVADVVGSTSSKGPEQETKPAETHGKNDSAQNIDGLQDDTVRKEDDSVPSNKDPDQDTKPAETQGTNDSDKTINDKTLGDASLVADDVGSTSLKGPEQDTTPAETKGTNDSGQNIDGLQDDTVRTNDDSLPSNKGPAKDTNNAETEGPNDSKMIDAGLVIDDRIGRSASTPPFDEGGNGDDDDNLNMMGEPDDMDSSKS